MSAPPAASAASAAPFPVGVLGGMGPAATWDFCARVLALSRAEHEQDNVRLIVDCNPHLPNRHDAVAGEGPSPGPALAAMARGLEAAGAAAIAIACNSAHAFAGEVRAAVGVPFLDMIAETAAETRRRHPQARTVGVLAAAACLDARLYTGAFAAAGVSTVEPRGEWRERFMALLWRVKAGVAGAASAAEMRAIAEALADAGAEVIVAGCTEVPLVLQAGDLETPLVDSAEVLAARVVAFAREGR